MGGRCLEEEVRPTKTTILEALEDGMRENMSSIPKKIQMRNVDTADEQTQQLEFIMSF